MINQSDSFLRCVLKDSINNFSRMDLEASWYDPFQVLAINKTEFNRIAKRICLFVNEKKIENFKDLKSLHVNDYINHVYSKIGTSCCGETANNLEGILSGNITYSDKMTKADMDSLVNELKKKAEIDKQGPWFCKASFGGHAFLIEFVEQRFTIHQSFFGSYKLCENVAENRFFDKEIFLDNLKKSYSIEANTEERARACKNLFNSFRIRTGAEVFYKFIENVSTDKSTISKRIDQLSNVFRDAWLESEKKKLENYCYKKTKETQQPQRYCDLDDDSLNAFCLGGHYNLTDDMFNNINEVAELKFGKQYYFKKFGPEAIYTYCGKENNKHLFIQ